MDWLCKAKDYPSAESHKRVGVGVFAARKRARELCATFNGHREFFDFEAEKANEEDDDEPTSIP